MRTRGLYKLRRHFQRDFHFRVDQQLREKICPGKVRGRDGRVLYGSKLVAESELYTELDFSDLSQKRHFYYDVLEGKPFTFTTEEARIRIQNNLLTIFLKSGGQVWALENYWTQVGVATGHSASIADFNCIPSRVSVSKFGFPRDFKVIVLFYLLVNLWALRLLFARDLLWLGIKRKLCPCFDHMCLFQALLHHCFVRLLKNLAAILECEKVYSLEFESTTTRRNFSLTFWEGKGLVTMIIAHCGCDVPVVKSNVFLSSQLLSAASTEPRIICCRGSRLEFIKALDTSPSQKTGIQYPLSLSPVHFEKLMHQPSFSVMGKIDMFSMLRTPLIRLSGLLDERWTQSTQYFRKVCYLFEGGI